MLPCCRIARRLRLRTRRLTHTLNVIVLAGSFSIGLADAAAGGPALRPTNLSPGLFAAAAMRAVAKELMAMKVDELKEELEARGEGKSGNKAWLRRRLHAAIVSEYVLSRETSREDTPMPEKKYCAPEARQLLHFYVFTGILCKCTLLHFYGQRAKLLRNPHPMVHRPHVGR